MTEPRYTLDLPGIIDANVKFRETKIIKQAMEVACHNKTEMPIFLTFSTQKPMFYFTKDDLITGVKSKITVPTGEQIEYTVTKDCEYTYSSKLLKNIANFPRCQEIDLKMHEKGVLEIEITISQDACVRHFINPNEL